MSPTFNNQEASLEDLVNKVNEKDFREDSLENFFDIFNTSSTVNFVDAPEIFAEHQLLKAQQFSNTNTDITSSDDMSTVIFAETEQPYSLFLSPEKGDFSGKMTSYYNNGIEIVKSSTQGTMNWIDTGKAPGGIGVFGNGRKGNSDKELETVTINLDDPADKVTISVVDHGNKNVDDILIFDVYQQGSSDPTQYTLVLEGGFENELISFDFEAIEMGEGALITHMEFYAQSQLGKGNGEANFLIADVEAFYIPKEIVNDDGDITPQEIDPAVFIVGGTGDDDFTSTKEFDVGEGFGVIQGGNNNDLLIGDSSGSYISTGTGDDGEPNTQDFNIAMILDISGSMDTSFADGTTGMQRLIEMTKGFMTEMSTYTNGVVQVHFTTFSAITEHEVTFTVNEDTGYQDAIDFIDGLVSRIGTNYEAGMQDTITWFNSDEAIEGALNYTYFISDGTPSHSVNDATGASVRQYNGEALEAVFGADGSDEVATLQQLSEELIAVAIDYPLSVPTNMDRIDSTGEALRATSGEDLEAIFQQTNPILRLEAVGDDVILGGEGDDFIFGDSLFTDILAQDHNLGTDPGAGWHIFELLESGASALNPDWDRADTLDYIGSNLREMMIESVTAEDSIRAVGSDFIDGGAGDDFIFGQEGHDTLYGGDGDDLIFGGNGDNVIYGGDGSDSLFGGDGTDIFVFKAGDVGRDAIRDFNSMDDKIDIQDLLTDTEYNASQDSIDDFLSSRVEDGNTILSLDYDGNASTSSDHVDFAVLEGYVDYSASLNLVSNAQIIYIG